MDWLEWTGVHCLEGMLDDPQLGCVGDGGHMTTGCNSLIPAEELPVPKDTAYTLMDKRLQK